MNRTFHRYQERLDPFLAEYRRVRRGIKGVSSPKVKEMELLAYRGSAMAMMYIADESRAGSIYQRNYDEAEIWYGHAANLGLSDAWLGIALIYFQRGDFAKAIEKLEVGAAENSGSSMRLLARMLRRGEGIEVDKLRALQLLRRSAKLGNVWAIRDLAQILMSGEFGLLGVPIGALMWISAALRAVCYILLGINETMLR